MYEVEDVWPVNPFKGTEIGTKYTIVKPSKTHWHCVLADISIEMFDPLDMPRSKLDTLD